ncbi:adenylate/guanylate cyclase domain-containing protein [Chitinivorax sp. B]|uniref:adenylate/guanylate cyclase domain-containing protein n=1 Tax=Chitinivorax sp. B TaxID=2502235 RepID=UPI0010F57840|nr:adenylate/guanylate cyclase domain-containing protein [Chitinivorax sp. B]
MAGQRRIVDAWHSIKLRVLLPIPLAKPLWLAIAMVLSVVIGSSLLWLHVDIFDSKLYDRIVAHNLRSTNVHTMRLVLDERIPLSVSREQTLTLYALAIERLTYMGARDVFLDAQIALRSFRKQTFVPCMPDTGTPPTICRLRGKPACLSFVGRPRHAPLDVDESARTHLVIPQPLSDRSPPAYDLLFGHRKSMPAFVDVMLPMTGDGIARSLYTRPGGVLSRLAPATYSVGRCNDGRPGCLPIRFDNPHASPNDLGIVALSDVASCNPRKWQALAPAVTGRIILAQLVGLEESVDIHPTPLLSMLNTHIGLMNGTHITQAGIETALLGDGPRGLSFGGQILLIGLAGSVATVGFGWLRFTVASMATLVVAAGLWWLSPMLYPWAQLPASPMATAALAAALIVVAGHMWFHTYQNAVLVRFMPPQIRGLLLKHTHDPFSGRQTIAIVLMSDLAGYTQLTNQLGSAKAIFELINDYLNEVTPGLQEHFDAWLEGYIGDLLCFYWPVLGELDDYQPEQQRERALRATIMLSQRQKAYFKLLAQRPMAQNMPPTKSLYAGIAVTEGSVFMGEIGPRHGVHKFGILGDPLNLAARLETLTRIFSSRLLVTPELVPTASALGHRPRHLATVKVKGRLMPTEVWAVHLSDEHVEPWMIEQWNQWRDDLLAGNTPPPDPPEVWHHDASVLIHWYQLGLWDDERGYFNLEVKTPPEPPT